MGRETEKPPVRPEPVSAARRPRHFHLLWGHELEELTPALTAVLARRDEVLANWHRRYLVHFGECRALNESEFVTLCGEDLDATLETLLRKDVDGFTEGVRRIGEKLVARGVPFSEVIASIHFFEESATETFPAHMPPEIYVVFDKLSHCRIIVLAEAYFRASTADADVRIHELERELERLSSAPPGRGTRKTRSNPRSRRDT